MIAEILTYIKEFHRKKLVTFQDCKAYYDKVPVAHLESEATWLLGDTMKALPFQLIFFRCYALFDEMTERAGCWAGFTDSQRMRFINATIDVKEKMLRRATPAVRTELMQKMHLTCKRIKKAGRYKKACDIIRASIRDYPGPFGFRPAIVIHPGSARLQ